MTFHLITWCTVCPGSTVSVASEANTSVHVHLTVRTNILRWPCCHDLCGWIVQILSRKCPHMVFPRSSPKHLQSVLGAALQRVIWGATEARLLQAAPAKTTEEDEDEKNVSWSLVDGKEKSVGAAVQQFYQNWAVHQTENVSLISIAVISRTLVSSAYWIIAKW